MNYNIQAHGYRGTPASAMAPFTLKIAGPIFMSVRVYHKSKVNDSKS